MGKPREGDLYRRITVADRTFEIRYGYCSEAERPWWDPAPVYPDFLREPQFSPDGQPFAMASQDVCPHYAPKTQVSGENWCNDCKFFTAGEEMIGLCACPACRSPDASPAPRPITKRGAFMKKLLTALLLPLLVVFLLTGSALAEDPCPGSDDGTHAPRTDYWESDATYHWRSCSNRYCGAMLNVARHTAAGSPRTSVSAEDPTSLICMAYFPCTASGCEYYFNTEVALSSLTPAKDGKGGLTYTYSQNVSFAGQSFPVTWTYRTNCDHPNRTWYEAVDATCDTPAMSEGWECATCGASKTPEKVAPALGHSLQPDDSTFVAPTCTEPGTTGRQACIRCDHATEPEEIPPLEHDIEEYDAFEPTCMTYGKTAGWKCLRCNEGVPQETIAPLGHIEVIIPAQEGTCETPAMTEGKYCDRCKETLVPSMPMGEAPGHDMAPDDSTFVAPTCTEPGMTGRQVCTRCDHATEPEEIPALEHDIEEYEGFAPTCTAYGKTDGWLCLRCKEGEPQQTIPALGHDMKSWNNGYPATCEHDGCGNSRYCTRCDYEEPGQFIPNFGHSLVVTQVYTPPTCTEWTKRTIRACTNEGCTYTEGNPDEPYDRPLGHDYQPYHAEATCTDPGLNDAERCTRCKAIRGGTVVPAGHVWGSWFPIADGDVFKHMRSCQNDWGHEETAVCTNVNGVCPECGREFDTQALLDSAYLANASGNLPNKIQSVGRLTENADVFLVPGTGEEGATLNFPSPLASDKTIMEFLIDYGGKQAVHPDDMLHPSMLDASSIPAPTFEFTVPGGQPMISVRGSVYADPNSNSTELAFIAPSQNVILLGTNGTWLNIATDTATGWLLNTNVLSVSAEPTINEDNELSGARAMLRREFYSKGRGTSFDILCDVLFAHRTDPNVGQILEEKLREKVVWQDEITDTLAVWPEALKRLNEFYQAAADAQAAYEQACADVAAARAFAETYEYVPKPQDLIPPAYDLGNGETAQFMFVSGKIYESPSEEATVLATVSNYGHVLGFSNGWYNVKVLDTIGWILLDSSRPYMQPDEERLYELAMEQVTGLSRSEVRELIGEVHTRDVDKAMADLAHISRFSRMSEEERREFAEAWIKANEDFQHARNDNRRLREAFEEEYQQAQAAYDKAVQEYEEACEYNRKLLEYLMDGGSSEDFDYASPRTAVSFMGKDGRAILAVARPVQGTEKDGMTSIPVSSRGGVYALIDTTIDQGASQGVPWVVDGYLRSAAGTDNPLVTSEGILIRSDGSLRDDGQDDGGLRADMSSQMTGGHSDGSSAWSDRTIGGTPTSHVGMDLGQVGTATMLQLGPRITSDELAALLTGANPTSSETRSLTTSEEMLLDILERTLMLNKQRALP